MSSPTALSLPPGPGASSAARSAGAGRPADRGTPGAFGSALEDALGSTGTPSRPAAGRPEVGRPEVGRPEVGRPEAGRPEAGRPEAGRLGGTPDDVAADAPADPAPDEQPDTGTPPAGELPPGIWALLTGAIGPAASPAAGTPTAGTPAGFLPPGLQTAVVAPVTAPDPAAVPVAGVPGTAAQLPADAPAAPTPAGHPASVADQVRGAAADALARAEGLTVVAAPADGVPAPPVVPAVPAPATAPGTEDAAAVGSPAAPTLPATGDGADGAGTGAGSGTPVPAPAADPAPADDPATGVSIAAQPAPGPAPAPATAGPAAARETPVAAQLAPQLAVLRNAPDGSQTMTLVLTPDSLGEVTVQVTITDGTLDVMLRGGSEHGRHALADALPDLRRDLEGAGLSFSRLAVDPDAPRDGGPGSRTAEQQLADMRGDGGQRQRHDSPRSRAWATPGAPFGEAGPVPAAHSSASSGVDVRV